MSRHFIDVFSLQIFVDSLQSWRANFKVAGKLYQSLRLCSGCLLSSHPIVPSALHTFIVSVMWKIFLSQSFSSQKGETQYSSLPKITSMNTLTVWRINFKFLWIYPLSSLQDKSKKKTLICLRSYSAMKSHHFSGTLKLADCSVPLASHSTWRVLV